MPVVVPYVPARPRSPLPHVFMIGAGFSKAIGEPMPTLDALGDVIAQHLAGRPIIGELRPSIQAALQKGAIPGGDLEAWLSSLASPAPFVSDVEAHFNAGLFSHIANEMGDEIDHCERDVLASAQPRWLLRLIQLWDVTGATVITFNYDTLIEHAASQPIWSGYHKWPEVGFRLLKLHGSTNWWRHRGTDPQGGVIKQKLLPGWGVPDEPRDPPGDERVMVPPIATKASFYDLSAIRHEWQDARRALEAATRLFIVGYRLPANDLASATLVSQHLAEDSRITIVNRDPGEPSSLIKKMPREIDTAYGGDTCVPEHFMTAYENIIAREVTAGVVEQFDDIQWDLPLLARIGATEQNRAVIDVYADGRRLVLFASNSDQYGAEHDKAVKKSDVSERLHATVRAGGELVVRSGEMDYPVLSIMEENYGARWAAVEA